MAEDSEKSVTQLIEQLGSKHVTERQHARAALVRAGSIAVPQLLDALDGPPQHVRWEAAKALAEIADPAAAERLVAALGDEDTDVRWVVGEALIALGRDAVNPALTALTKSDLSDEMSSGAHHVLHELAKRPELKTRLEPVLDAFKELGAGIAVQVAAAEALKLDTP